MTLQLDDIMSSELQQLTSTFSSCIDLISDACNNFSVAVFFWRSHKRMTFKLLNLT